MPRNRSKIKKKLFIADSFEATVAALGSGIALSAGVASAISATGATRAEAEAAGQNLCIVYGFKKMEIIDVHQNADGSWTAIVFCE